MGETSFVKRKVSNLDGDDETKRGTNVSTPCHRSILFKIVMFLAIVVIIIFALFAATILYVGYGVSDFMKETVVPQITTDQPLNLDIVILPKSERKELMHKIDEFRNIISHQEQGTDDATMVVPAEDFVLTEKEINGLICSKTELCGSIYLTILDNMLSTKFSLPIDDMSGGEARFFVGTNDLVVKPLIANNGPPSYFVQYTIEAPEMGVWKEDEDFPLVDMALNVELNEDVGVHVKALELFGWKSTDGFIRRFLNGVNWASINKCPHAKKALTLIKGVTIGDKKIVFHFKRETV